MIIQEELSKPLEYDVAEEGKFQIIETLIWYTATGTPVHQRAHPMYYSNATGNLSFSITGQKTAEASKFFEIKLVVLRASMRELFESMIYELQIRHPVSGRTISLIPYSPQEVRAGSQWKYVILR